MVTGGAFVFIWKFGIAKLGGIFAIYELLPAFIIALVVNVSVSLLTKAPSKEIQEEFDVTISAKDIIPENFNSAKAIWELIERIEEEEA